MIVAYRCASQNPGRSPSPGDEEIPRFTDRWQPQWVAAVRSRPPRAAAERPSFTRRLLIVLSVTVWHEGCFVQRAPVAPLIARPKADRTATPNLWRHTNMMNEPRGQFARPANRQADTSTSKQRPPRSGRSDRKSTRLNSSHLVISY